MVRGLPCSCQEPPRTLPPVLPLLAAFVASALVTLWLVHLCRARPGKSLDDNFEQPQKIHKVPALLLACAMPAFLSGLLHDFTDGLTPKGRLVATAVSAVLAYVVLGAQIRQSDIPGLDMLLATSVGSLFFTVLAVAGIANAINIIDGLNGLASMCVVIMLAAVAYVA
jgi:UDP-N-acetylmuramyl pentapeptide phosphotransferase/UDP-N-acetylglucosamine-1-phosphate transferase